MDITWPHAQDICMYLRNENDCKGRQKHYKPQSPDLIAYDETAEASSNPQFSLRDLK